MSDGNDFMSGFYAGRNNNDNGNGGFGGNGWGWIWIILIFAVFAGGWGGFGGWGGQNGAAQGAASGYTLASDFATIQRQLSDGFGAQAQQLSSISNGICSLGYDQLSQINGVNTNILTQGNATQMAMMQGFNGLQSQIADCCCTNRYDNLVNANATQRAIENGFCQTGYNLADQSCQTRTLMQTNTRDVIDNANQNARAILDAIQQQSIAKKDEKIAEQNQRIFQLQLKASQEAQNAYLISQLGYQCPKPAYVVQPPQQVTFPVNCCGQATYSNGGCANGWTC